MDDARGKSIAITIAIFTGLLVIIVASGFLIRTAWAGSQSSPLTSQIAVDRDTVTAIGVGVPSTVAKKAIVHFIVETSGRSASQSLQANEDKVRALIQSLEQSGASKEAIHQGAAQISTDQGNSQSTNITVRTPVQVQLDSPSTLGNIIDRAVQSGFARVDGVTYLPGDPQAAQAEAEKAALEDARRKAIRLAALDGRTLGPMLGMRELPQSPGPFQPSGAGLSSPAGEPGILTVLQVTWSLSPASEGSSPPATVMPGNAAGTSTP